ncbi:MAG TPA: VOC family protein, partial [Verrucomicrobiae bacterium]|nr:VOC family protein [Verrucomicrobiae bacterium]
MISGFDHVVIAVRDLEAGTRAYETLLARPVSARFSIDGIDSALIGLDNIAIELIAPGANGVGADRLRTALEDGEGLKSIVFGARDLPGLHSRAARVGLAPEPINAREDYDVFRFATERTHGVRLMALERRIPAPRSSSVDASVSGIDHIVVRTPDAERAAALYGARLGLDMRLDREVAGRRLMFFRCGDAIMEIVHDPSLDNGRDNVWGLSWRVANADDARARLAESGLNVS